MKQFEKAEKETLKLLEKAAGKELKVHSWEWPPACMSLFAQPKRPKRHEN